MRLLASDNGGRSPLSALFNAPLSRVHLIKPLRMFFIWMDVDGMNSSRKLFRERLGEDVSCRNGTRDLD